MKWMYWSQNGEDHRRSTKTRSWKKADRVREELEHSLDPLRAELKRLKEGAQRVRVKLTEACADFLADAATKTKGPGTRWMLEYLLGRLLAWCEGNGIHYLDEITVNHLTRWRSTWPSYKTETIRTYQAKVGKFFKFCVCQGWLEHNPVSRLTPIRGVPSCPTGYFDREEFKKLVTATSSLSDSHARPNFAIRMRTMLLLRRWSGLRLGDAVTLERSRLMGDRILLYQSKTGLPVFVPLRHDVAEALREIPAGRNPNPCYFFWDGFNKRSAVRQWMEDFQKLFRLADLRTPDGKPKRCHGQMVRDTFAVEMLIAGIPIEQVSVLLGHSSIGVTQKRYLPWVAARQKQLEASVRKAYRVPGITKCARRKDVEKEPSLFSSKVSETGSKSKKIA
ncbi:MAG: tyrosine-type recombinase/integrase [Candidatus Sulfotelmatobacter sp.]|jgi:site-specific recombinase XerD